MLSRRSVFTGMLAASVAQAQRPAASRTWQPKLGIYCRYSLANLEFARNEGFTCVQLNIGGPLPPDPSSAQLDAVKENIRKSGLAVVALGLSGNHLEANPAARTRFQDRFANALELAASLK